MSAPGARWDGLSAPRFQDASFDIGWCFDNYEWRDKYRAALERVAKDPDKPRPRERSLAKSMQEWGFKGFCDRFMHDCFEVQVAYWQAITDFESEGGFCYTDWYERRSQEVAQVAA